MLILQRALPCNLPSGAVPNRHPNSSAVAAAKVDFRPEGVCCQAGVVFHRVAEVCGPVVAGNDHAREDVVWEADDTMAAFGKEADDSRGIPDSIQPKPGRRQYCGKCPHNTSQFGYFL
jgi:hypothetical protein